VTRPISRFDTPIINAAKRLKSPEEIDRILDIIADAPPSIGRNRPRTGRAAGWSEGTISYFAAKRAR
jgi:hypothetical protein